MLPLLRAELSALANLFRSKPGRRVVFVNLLALVYFAFLSAVITKGLLGHPHVRDAVRGPDGPTWLAFWFSLILAPVAILVGLTSMKAGERLLFSGPELDFLVAAPVPRWALPARAWLRMVFLNLLWGVALLLPACAVLFGIVRAPWTAALAVPAAVLLLCAPVLAAVLAAQIVIMRWFAGPKVKRILGVALGLSYLVFAVLALIGIAGPDEGLENISERLAQLDPQSVRGTLLPGAPARLLALAAGGGGADATLFAQLAALVAACVVLIGLSGAIYGRAFENERIAAQPASRRGRRRGWLALRSWPAEAAASLFRKDLAALIQQPGRLLGILMFTLVIALLGSRSGFMKMTDPAAHYPPEFLQHSQLVAVPPVLRYFMAQLALFAWACIMTLPGIAIGLSFSEAKHWSLLANSPAPRSTLFRGKAAFPAINMAWYALCAAAVGVLVHGASIAAAGVFLLAAPPVVYGLLGLSCALGTLPFLARPDTSGEGARAVRGVLAAILVAGGVILACWPGAEAWSEIKAFYAGRGAFEGLPDELLLPLLLAGLWIAGLLTGWAGRRVAVWNFERLTGPAPQ